MWSPNPKPRRGQKAYYCWIDDGRLRIASQPVVDHDLYGKCYPGRHGNVTSMLVATSPNPVSFGHEVHVSAVDAARRLYYDKAWFRQMLKFISEHPLE